MNESFQIIATLAAVRLALSLAPDAEARLVQSAGRRDGRTAFAAALGFWLAAVFAAALALLGLDLVVDRLVERSVELRGLAALYLAVLALASVRRAFAAPVPLPPAPAVAMTARSVFRHALRGALAEPATVLLPVAVFTLTGAAQLAAPERLFAALAMPTVALAWNLVGAAAGSAPGLRPIRT